MKTIDVQKELNQIALEGRKRSEDGQLLLHKLLHDLSELGINIKQLREQINKPIFEAAESDRNFSAGLTRHDNVTLREKWNKFLTAQKKFNSRINISMTALESDFRRELSSDEISTLSIRYMKSLLNKVKRKYSATIFFAFFKELLESEYAEKNSPFTTDKEFFKHVLRHVDPNVYLRPEPLHSNSHLWNKSIIQTYKIVRPAVKSNNKAYIIVSRLLLYSYPNSFTGVFDDETVTKYSLKVRRIIEKARKVNTEI